MGSKTSTIMAKNNEDLANSIQKRANAANISITQLCRQAGVSRRWFEDCKKRVPRSVDIYMKIDRALQSYENGEAAADGGPTPQ